MLIKEYRIILPMTVEEYNIAQLWSVAEASKNETGGGEGVEVVINKPFDKHNHQPDPPLMFDDQPISDGQYTHKRYYLANKVPSVVRFLAPKGALEVDECAWNSYPYCRTIVTNPEYMKENFALQLDSIYAQDDGETENIHQLSPELLEQREVVYIDIVNDPLYSSKDYDPTCNPTTFQSVKTGRGPLVDSQWWKNTSMPIMCCYKLISCEFKWWGLQTRVEQILHDQERRILLNFHRQLFCWMDKWHGLSMKDIRDLEENAKIELDQQRYEGDLRGTIAAD